MKKRITLLAVVGLLGLISLPILLAPKSVLTMGVEAIELDDKGELKIPESLPGQYRELLKKEGITLKFKAPTKENSTLTPIELMQKDPGIDFVLVANTDIRPSSIAYKDYMSLGTVHQIPLYFYEKANSSNDTVRFLGDLDKKKVAFFSWTRKPEDFDFFKYQWELGAEKKLNVHPFSYEAVVKLLLDEVRPENMRNPFPEAEVSMTMDWDILLTPHLPFGFEGMTGVDMNVANGLFAEKSRLVDFSDIEALSMRHPSLKIINVPAGLISSKFKVPDRNIKVVAYEESVVGRRDMEPGMALSLASVLQTVHSGRTVFNKRGSYPYFSDYEAFDPSDVVRDFYKDGKPFLSHYFSLKYAFFFHNLFIVLLPLLTIGFPLFNAVPALHKLYVRRKFDDWYARMREIEESLAVAESARLSYLSEKIEHMDKELSRFRFGFDQGEYVQGIYIAREHLDFIRKKISAKKSLDRGAGE